MMFDELKSALTTDPNKMISLLEKFGFVDMRYDGRYIRCARGKGSGPNISVAMDGTTASMDFVTHTAGDVFGFIQKLRGVPLSSVLRETQSLVGTVRHVHVTPAFGGFYDNMTVTDYVEPYDESVLNSYVNCGNVRFFNDGIGYKTQRVFEVGYDEETDMITIPIRNNIGDLVAVKGRRNFESDTMPKYTHLLPRKGPSVLYGLHINYPEITDTVTLVEAEKAVMQGYEFGARDLLACGTCAITEEQARLVTELRVKCVRLGFDSDVDDDHYRRAELQLRGEGFEGEIQRWKPSCDTPSKSAPTDIGKEFYNKCQFCTMSP